MTRSPSKTHRGLTLFELLVASILAVLLLTTMLGFLRAMTDHERLSNALTRDNSGVHLLSCQIESDFSNARFYQATPNGIVLSGFLTRDRRSGIATYRSSKVRYDVDTELRVLTRSEESSDGSGPRGRIRTQPMLENVAAIRIVPIEEMAKIGASQRQRPAGMKDLPFWYRVEVVGSGGMNALKMTLSR